MHATGCRRCLAAQTGRDVARLGARELSYAAVLRGHTPQSLSQLVQHLERRHVLGVTTLCPACKTIGICVAPLAAGAPGVQVCEHILALQETLLLYGLVAD